MSQSKAERPDFSFNRGINTDASPLTFPPNFSTDELNYELLLDGTRRRRRGLIGESEIVDFPVVENPDPFSDDVVALVQAHTGTLVEATGNPTMTVVGDGAVSSVQAKFGSSSFLNPGTWPADGDYVKLEDSVDGEGLFIFPGEFTVEGWYYFNSVNTDVPFTGIGSGGVGSAFSWSARLQSGPVYTHFFNSTATGPTESIVPIPINQWVHLAISRDSSANLHFFMDGVKTLTDATSNAGTINTFVNPKSVYGIGFASDGGGGGQADADFYFDQVRITKRCRYTDSFAVPDAPYELPGPVTPVTGSGLLTDDQPDEAVVRTFKWRSVGGSPDMNLHCVQIGSQVLFMDDVEIPSANIRNFSINLETLAVEGFADQVGLTHIDMAFGRGHAIIVGKYIEPHFVEYDVETDTLITTAIQIRERDFQGVDDGVDNQTRPGSLTEQYQYNLINQGWIYGDVLAFQAAQGNYPSKNMIPWYGYRRATVVGFDPNDGTKEFSPDKLVAELFQDAPAPRGHFVRNPFDTNLTIEVDAQTVKNYVSLIKPAGHAHFDQLAPPGIPSEENGPNHMIIPDLAYPGTSASTLLTFKFNDPHFLSVGETFEMFTESAGKIGSLSGDGNRLWEIKGNHTVEAVIDDNTISFYNTLTKDGAGWRSTWPYSYWPTMYAFVGGDVVSIEGTVIDERPTAAAFFAGRAVYAGVPHPSLGSALFFSQVVEVDEQYGKCYQVADPTSDKISDIIATDGLVLRIPEVGRVYKIKNSGASLLVWASNGVWQIGPGGDGYFTAVSYSVRKLSNIQIANATSVVDAEELPMAWASSGVFCVVQDPNTGFLVVKSLTEGQIDTLFAAFGDTVRRTSTGDYDQTNKRVVWTYQQDDEDFALAYDTRFRAFTIWKFETPVYDIFTTTQHGNANSTLRFVVKTEDGFIIATATSLDFLDFGADTEAYMVTGFDTANSPARRKQAPIVTVFSKRTELATESGVVNESSTFMQSRWDWADNSVAGKWGVERQVYRKRRPFSPDPSDTTGVLDDGQPVLVTRNKVRGRGRCFQLKFVAEPGSFDSHILGWATNFTVNTDT